MKQLKKIYIPLLFLLIISILLIPEGTKVHNVKIEDIVLAILIFTYLISIIIDKDVRNNIKNKIRSIFSDQLSVSIFILSVIMIVSIFYSYDKKIAINETIRFIIYGLLYFIILVEANDKMTDSLIKLLNVLVFILCAYGILQFFTGIGVDKAFIADYSYGAKLRIDATLGNPDSYGAFLILTAFPIFSLFFNAKEKKKKIFYLVLSLMVVANIIFTGSRNAYLGLLLGLLILTLYNKKKYILALVGFTGVMFIIPVVRNRLLQVFDSTQDVARIKIWKVAIKMIKDHPIFGVGNGNFYSLYNKYITKYPKLMYESHKYYTTHNSFLKIQSELGILGIVSFIAILLLALVKVYKASKLHNDKFTNSYYTGFVAAIVAFYFMNLFDNLFFVPKTTSFYWILLALAQGIIFRNNGKFSEE